MQLEADLEYAKSSPFPPLGDLFTDVYAGSPPPFIRTCEYPQSIKNASS